jgi:Kef-type K+ transport system membrane component KefB
LTFDIDLARKFMLEPPFATKKLYPAGFVKSRMLEEIWNELTNAIWFKLTLLLTVAIASNFLFARFGQPKIIGQILLGIVIGPSVIGLINVNQSDPADIVVSLANLGAIILLFMIGLECKIKEIYTKRAVVIALGGVLLPWAAGFAIAELMLPVPPPPLDKFAQSVFVGAALVATSVAITAAVLREMGVLGSTVAKTILGAAVVDDVLGMIVLAISSGIAKGGGIEFIDLVLVIIAAVAFVAIGAFVGSRYLMRVAEHIEKKGIQHNLPESGFLFILSMMFLYSVIAETIGISAIVGAFVAGTSLAGCEFSSKFMERTAVLEWVFAPVFFLSLGILVNIRLPLELWVFAIALTVVAFLTKLVGCGLPARYSGMSKKDAIVVGVGMSPRMEVAMIIALYALSVQIISHDVYSIIVLMGLLTAVFTPYLLKKTMKHIPVTGEICDMKETRRAGWKKI